MSGVALREKNTFRLVKGPNARGAQHAAPLLLETTHGQGSVIFAPLAHPRKTRAKRPVRLQATRWLLWQNSRFIEMDLWHTVQHSKKSGPRKRRRRSRSPPRAALRKQPEMKNASAYSTPSAVGATWRRRSIPS